MYNTIEIAVMTLQQLMHLHFPPQAAHALLILLFHMTSTTSCIGALK